MTLTAEPGRVVQTSALSARGVSKTFAGSKALDSLDLDILPGEVHALLGENGSGKSTFIKVLSGFHRPDDGSLIEVDGSAVDPGSADSSYRNGCRFVHQDLGLIGPSSIVDNLAFGGGFPTRWGTIRHAEDRRRAQADLAKVGLHLDPRRRLDSLSPAERTGVAVARALRDDPAAPVKVLVLDEPTAALPDAEVVQLMSIVRAVTAHGVGVLYVTHRLDEVFDIADRVTVLRDGLKVAERPADQLTRDELVTLLVGNELEEVRASLPEHRDAGAAPALEVKELTSGPLADVSLEARPGEIIGIAGITGSGRDTILGAIFGANRRSSGSVRVGGVAVPAFRPDVAKARGMAFLPPDRKTLAGVLDLSARENLTLADLAPFWRRGPILRRRAESQAVRVWFERLDVRPRSGAERPLATFSGGNQQKILVAKWLRRRPAVFLMDEPTQGVDVGAKAGIHSLVLEAARDGAAIVVSSTDIDELAALCHEVIVLRSGRVAAHLTRADVTPSRISREVLETDDSEASRWHDRP